MTSKGRNPLTSSEVDSPLEGEVVLRTGDGKRPRNAAQSQDLRATQHDVAAYIERLAADLRAMSQSVDLDSLAYFLEMARLEASIQVERLGRSIDREPNASGL